MSRESNNPEWIIRIPKSRTKKLVGAILIFAIPLILFRGCQLLLNPGTMITSEVLAPDHWGEPWGINYVARTIGVRAKEFLRIVRFVKAQESDTRDEYFRSSSFKWLSGRNL